MPLLRHQLGIALAGDKPEDDAVTDESADVGLGQASRFIRDGWDSIPAHLKFAFLVLFDASLGLRYESGILSLLIYGDPLWILQFFEFVLSSIYIFHWLLNNLQGRIGTLAVILAPIAILLSFAFCLEQLFLPMQIKLLL